MRRSIRRSALILATLAAAATPATADDRYDSAISAIYAQARDGRQDAAVAAVDALARRGDVDAIMAAAEIWRDGLPEAGPLRRPQPERAIELYRRAALVPDAHQGRALFELSELLKDADAAEDAFQRSIALGYARSIRTQAMRLVAEAPSELPAPDLALTLLRMAAADKDADAAGELARLIRSGRAVGDADSLAATAIAGLEAEAAGGQASAMADLAEVYAAGVLAPADPEVSAMWLKRASEAGNLGASMDLAKAAIEADPPDYAGAAAIYMRAIEAGHAKAALNFARLHYDHAAPEVAAKDAALWLDRAVAVDHIGAMVYAASRAKDGAETARLLRTAETKWRGEPGAALDLAAAFDPEGGFAPDLARARLWYDRALARADSADAYAKYGSFKLRQAGTTEETQAAMTFLNRAADMGDTGAMITVGDAFDEGLGGLAPDPARALALYRKAVENGSVTAKSRAAQMLYDGRGAPRDSETALGLWREAADAGNLGAMTKLGRALVDQAGGPEEAERAVLRQSLELFHTAARAGNASAMSEVAELLLSGALGPPQFDEARLWLRRAADAGRTSALVTLARSYIQTEDAEQAVAVYRDAAELGSVDSMVELARAYSLGLGVPRDIEVAQEWLARATEAGGADPRTMELIARGYLTPEAGAGDKQKGVELLERAANLGNTRSALTLARHYKSGAVLARDLEKAFQWFMRAAEAGSVTAMVEVGTAYGAGRGVPADSAKAFEWLQRSVSAGSDSATALIAVGRAFADGVGVEKDTRRAFDYYRRAASLGSSKAMQQVAYAYQRGQGVDQQPEKAIEWFQRAAANGSTSALNELGRAFASGFGTPVDQERAFRYFQDAAARGSLFAMRQVGRFLIAGNVIAQDTDAALGWYRRAAEAGNLAAMTELATIYQTGSEVPRDRAIVLEWLGKAAAAGSDKAKFQLAEELLAEPEGERDMVFIRRLLGEAAAAGDDSAERLLRQLDQAG